MSFIRSPLTSWFAHNSRRNSGVTMPRATAGLILLTGWIVTSVSTMLSAETVAGTSYYFSASGSDNNDCKSTATPCQTIARLNSLTYAKDDSILLHGGDSFIG